MAENGNRVSWPLPTDTISPSSIGTFIKCAEQYRRKYVLGIREPFGVSALMGNAVHGAQERNFRVKMVNEKGITLPEIEDSYLESFEKEVDEAGGYSEIDWRMGDGKIRPGKAKDLGRPVNRLYFDRVAPRIQPLAVEQWVRRKIPGVHPVLVAKIDVIARDAIFDMKFGGSAPSKPRPDWLLQGNIYHTAHPDLPFGWHTGRWGGSQSGPYVATPYDTPTLWLEPEPPEVTDLLIAAYAGALVAYYNRFGPDEPWPGTGKAHQFACGYCPFHPSKGGDCLWWSGWKAPVPIVRDIPTL